MRLRRTIDIIGIVVGTVWFAVKLAADWIGRSTVIEDATALGPKAVAVVDWIANQPGLVFYGIPLALLAVIVLDIFFRRGTNIATATAASSPDERAEVVDEPNKNDLFRINYARMIRLERAIVAVEEKRERVIKYGNGVVSEKQNPIPTDIPRGGLYAITNEYLRGLHEIMEISRSIYPSRQIDLMAAPGLTDNPFRKVPGQEKCPDEATGYEYKKAYLQYHGAIRQIDALMSDMKREYDETKERVASAED